MSDRFGIEVRKIVLGGMIVKVIVNKSKIKPLNGALFSKDGQVGVVGQHFVDAVQQRIGNRELRIGLAKRLNHLGIPLIYFHEHIAWSASSAGFKIERQANFFGPSMLGNKQRSAV